MHPVAVGFQRQVGRSFFLAPTQFEFFSGIAAFQPNRHQHERCVANIRLVVRIDPLEGAKRQNQDIDTLFLLQGACIVVEVQPAR